MSNLVLTGFMGVGKSTVGATAARLLGRRLVDTDRELAGRFGGSPAQLVAEGGEAALRRAEATLCQELRATDGLVIATGGGTLVDPGCRAALGDNGVLICLGCSVDELLRRLEASGERPLLAGDDRRAAIERLLEARSAAYEAIPWQIDTTGRTVAQTARSVVGLARSVTLEAQAGSDRYPVHLGHGLLDQVGAALRATGAVRGARVALVSNPVVAPLHAERAADALRAAGLRPFACLIPDGEQHKTLATVEGLYRAFLAGGLERRELVLALGGGVTGDVAGFAAATYKRGVAFANVPTSLLAMVDASVGGKTGVDLAEGKNLVGAFHQPQLVLVDPTLLETLDPAHLRAAVAEMVKHGLLGDPGLFDALATGSVEVERWWSAEAMGLIERALRVKLAVVAIDPEERGRRATLNLGHTVGHALEALAGYAGLLHGEAVAIGLCAAARIARDRGIAAPQLVERIEATLGRWGLPLRCRPHRAAAIVGAMAHDKKRSAGAMRWVLPRDVGDVVLVDDVAPEAVTAALSQIGAID